MIDSECSESVVVMDEAAVPAASELVVADCGGQSEESDRDSGHEAGHRVRAMALQRELAFEGVDDRFDPLADRAEPAEATRLVFAIGPQQSAAHLLDHRFEVAAGEPLVSQDRATVDREALEDLRGDLAFADVGASKLKADRHPVGCADEHEPKSPVMAGVRATPTVRGVASQLRPPSGIARLAARDRSAIKQPQPVAVRRRFEDQLVEQPDDLRRQLTDALVVARLLRQIRKQVPQAVARDRQEPAVTGTIQQHLRNGQTDQLGIGNPGRPASATARQQEVIGQHVESDEERVEAGGHWASKVDGARTPSVFDTSTALSRGPARNTESI